MSLLPILREALREIDRPAYLFDQNFGLGLLSDDLLEPICTTVPLYSGYYRPWRHLAQRRSGVSNIENSKDGFKVNLDVQQFLPDEVSVKMVDDSLIVEGKHEERQDEHGFISRQFVRRYKLPANVELDALTSKLSSDGVLTITAPKKELLPANSKERVVPIIQTQSPALEQSSGRSSNQEKMEQ